MDLDQWIAKVKEGQHLSEDELQLLCEYVPVHLLPFAFVLVYCCISFLLLTPHFNRFPEIISLMSSVTFWPFMVFRVFTSLLYLFRRSSCSCAGAPKPPNFTIYSLLY